MRPGDYEIVRFEAGLLEEAATLRHRTWGATVETQIEYLRWKYLENPYVEAPLLHLALHGGRAVGMRGLYGTCWDRGSARFVFPATSDSTILEEHRGADLYARLGDAFRRAAHEDGFTHLVNPTSGENALAAVLSQGWRAATPQQPMVRRLPRHTRSPMRTPGVTARRAGRKLQRLLGVGGQVTPFGELDRRAAALRPGLHLHHRAPTDVIARFARSDEAPGPAGPDGPALRPTRDEPFTAWRYRDPLGSYRFLVSADGAAGYLALGWRPSAYQVVILDWDADDAATSRRLLEAALAHARHAVAAWAAGLTEPQREVLEVLGFEPVPSTSSRERVGRRLLARPVADTPGEEDWAVDGVRLDEDRSWAPLPVVSDAV